MTSRKLQIFKFVLIEMFTPCSLNSRVISFLVRSDCGPLAFLRSTRQPVVSVESYVAFAVFLAEIVQEEKTDKLTNFRSVEAAHSYVEHVAVVFLGPGGLVVK